jgi:hypothetical protein
MRIPTAPITSPAAWEGPSLEDRDDWIHAVTPEERAELSATLQALGARREPLAAIDVKSYPLPTFGPTLRRIREDIKSGRGFVLLRGVPVADVEREDISRLYWLFGRHLGDPVPQNVKGDLIADVRDTGADPKNANTRLYTTRAEQDFHTDAADIIGLLCLQGARRGGLSRIVSSVRVFNELLSRRPDLAPLLFEDWYWHFHGQEAPGELPYVRFPICRFQHDALSTFFIAWYIRRAPELPGVPPLTPARAELLGLIESIANDPRFYLDMDFRPGDVQLLKNSVILHKRTEYEDWDEPQRKRHLLRLWLAAPDFDDGNELLRLGIRRQNSNAKH